MAQSKIAIITPYLAQPGTQFYVESFEASAKGQGLGRQCHRYRR
jgi:ribose transport system substrate-binding protein